MALDLNSILGLLGTLGGGALSANAAGNSSSQLNSLLRSLQGNATLNPFTFSGPGGASAGVYPNGMPAGFGQQPSAGNGAPGNMMYAGGSPAGFSIETGGAYRPTPNGGIQQIMGGASSPGTGMPGGGAAGTNLGILNPAYSQLAGLGTGFLGNVPFTGTPTGVSDAANGLATSSGAFSDLQSLMGGFQPGLANAAYGGALGKVNEASNSYDNVFNSTLTNLRNNAAPQNLLAANQLQDSLFGTGRMGTTGGGNLATAFAKGLGQADASYQLQAQQQAMLQQNNSLGLAQGLAGIGSGITGMGENLKAGAFGRGQQLLTNQVGLASLPFDLQGKGLNLGLSALSGAGALNSQGLQNFQAALQAAVAQSNARNQTAGAQANLAGTRAQTPTSSDIWGQVLSGIGSRAGSAGGIGGILGSLFGGSGGGGLSQQDISDIGGYSDQWGDIFNQMPANNDFENLFGNSGGGFNGAGGQAADDGLSPVQTTVGRLPNGQSTSGAGSNFLGNAGAAASTIGGVASGNYAGAARGAGKLANSAGYTDAGKVLGGAGSALGIYQGIDQGGVQGYANAVQSAGQLASQLGLIDTGVASAGAGAGASVGGTSGGGIMGLVGLHKGIKGLTGSDQGKFAGTASAAAAGMQVAGPWGALVGAALGYLKEGGAKDSVPWDAAGFSGTTMDKAWEDQNIARLASNPAASIGSKLGIKSDSVLGKILDPSALFSKHGDEKRNVKAFTSEMTLFDAGGGSFALSDGTKVTKDKLQQLAGAWYGATFAPDGDQKGWQMKYIKQLYDVYGTNMPPAELLNLPPIADTTTPKLTSGGKAAKGYQF